MALARKALVAGRLACSACSSARRLQPLKAQGGQPQTRVSDPAWQATYWNNIDLSGAPMLVRSEPEINYNWGSGSPAPEVNSQRFSARWTRYIYFESDGLYRFVADQRRRRRLFIDDQLVVDAWYDHAAKTFVVDRQLRAGHHLLRVEYYNNSSPALVQFAWASLNPPQPVITAWRGEYFNNRDLVGDPVLVRDDPSVDFNWGLGSPAPGVVNVDNFSARWTRTLNLPAGAYRFRVTVDDGVRLYVNNRRVMDQWRVQAAGHFHHRIRSPCLGSTADQSRIFRGDRRRTHPGGLRAHRHPGAARGRRLARRVLQQHGPSPGRPSWCAMIPTSTSTGASARRPQGS